MFWTIFIIVFGVIYLAGAIWLFYEAKHAPTLPANFNTDTMKFDDEPIKEQNKTNNDGK